ncbi:MAG: glycoside hydrolase family 3 C-terminal domain-containing protein [Chloroflexota bacterium]
MTDTKASYPFQNCDLPLETRVNDLVARLTLAEKISLLHQYQPAIPRLGISAFRTGGEALHGVAWLGTATVFPQAIGLGSTWNPELVQQIGAAVGDEVRGYHYKNRALHSLNVWAPVVDLLRDPRAGRNEEGYAEDPYLTGQMSMAYAGGLQGDDPFYLKTAPSLKHFFAYNQEIHRDVSDSNIDARNMHEYYLQAFYPAIAANKATGVMTSYNLVNGRPNTLTPYLNTMLRQWTDQPLLVVSDAVAPSNIVTAQKYYATDAEGHAAAIKAGMDSFTDHDADPTLTIAAIQAALDAGLLTEMDIDTAVSHIFSIRIRLGEFDPQNPYADITDAAINTPAHQALAREAARQQFVLLKNEANTLPLDKNALTHLAVIGQRANELLTDWYSGTFPYTITPLAAIQQKMGNEVTVSYAADNTDNAAAALAQAADAAIVIVGNHPTCNAGWAQCEEPSEGKEAIDRQALHLPTEALIQQVYAANPRTIVVLLSSFPYTINWTNDHIPAIVWSSHAGQELGHALAELLFGDCAPAGRLPQTWYAAESDLPDILAYDIIKNKRTYLYFDGTPLYPFGHGLTYAPFAYANLRLSASAINATEQVTIQVDVTNNGTRASDEVVQLYVHARQSRVQRPFKELKGFRRQHFEAGETRTIQFTLAARDLAFWDVTGDKWTVEAGVYDILIGKSSAAVQLAAALTVHGETIPPRDLTQLTRAENFDAYHGAKLVDETKPAGTAVAAAPGEWIAFKDVDFANGLTHFSASIANATAEPANLEIRLDNPAGTLVGTVVAPVTGDVYAWTAVTTPIHHITGIHDLYLVFGGTLRISTFQFQHQ